MLIAAVTIALVLIGALLFLLAIGVLSTAVLVALARRSVSAGFRSLFLMLGTLTGIPIGIAAAWIADHLLGSALAWRVILPVGAVLGAVGGWTIAAGLNVAWGKVFAQLVGRQLPGFEVAAIHVEAD